MNRRERIQLCTGMIGMARAEGWFNAHWGAAVLAGLAMPSIAAIAWGEPYQVPLSRRVSNASPNRRSSTRELVQAFQRFALHHKTIIQTITAQLVAARSVHNYTWGILISVFASKEVK